MAEDAIATYGRQLGITSDGNKIFTSFTIFAMLVDYVVEIFTIPKLISQQKTLTISALTGIIFICLVFITKGYISITFITLLGLANALMWPSIFS